MTNNLFIRRRILEMIESHQMTSEKGLELIQDLLANEGNEVNLDVYSENSSIDTKNEVLFFQNKWKQQNITDDNPTWSSLGNILLFDISDKAKVMIKDELKEKQADDTRIILVQPGKIYRDNGNDVYEINIDSAEDYKRLVKELADKKILPNTIIHKWCHDFFQPSENAVRSQLSKGIYSLLNLTQSLMGLKSTEKVKLIYLYPRYEEQQPLQAAMGSFARTLRVENPRFQYRTVGVDVTLGSAVDTTEIIKYLLREVYEDDDIVDVCYMQGQRFIKVQEELSLKNVENDKLPLREKGVYIITGGLGRLGLIFAQYLANKVQARLVLSGHGELKPKHQEIFDQLISRGAEVIYVKADVSKRQDVTRLVREAKNRFNEINGIFHCAGALRDSFILKKTKAEMEEVFASKIFGTINLDETSWSENLDLFVLFSSAAALIGNPGQSDYSFANSFMDNYAEMRSRIIEKGRTISINWPLWKEGGMQVSKKIINQFDKLHGAKLLETETGIKAFENALKFNVNQLLVISGNEKKIRNTFTNKDKANISVYNDERVDRTNYDKNIIKLKVESYLKELLSKEIKLPVSDIDSMEPLEMYGIDSIMILNLTTTLEERFSDLSKTLFFEHENLKELAEYFIENHYEKIIGELDNNSFQLNQVISDSEVSSLQENTLGIHRFHAQEVLRKNVEKDWRDQQDQEDPKDNKEDKVISNIRDNAEDIAIIGLSGRYPMARNLDEFWENIKCGRDCITEIPESRWDYRQFYHGDEENGIVNSKWGGFIEDIDMFDPMFFNIAPREAKLMDPQERLFLEIAWSTIEDAGYSKSSLDKSKVGVFVGVMNGHYQLYGLSDSLNGNLTAISSSYASIANRVSYCLNLHGPSLSIDTMCSSSLTAIHYACQSIRSGESDLAIAGGVNLLVHPYKYLILSQGKFASSDGKCRSFGEGGDGYVPGEGVGAVLLKPLRKAINDGDYIYGVIKGTSVNHGGKTNGFTVPNPNAQAQLILDSFQKADIDPRTISYIEAHGTGTSLGDPIEITGLIKAFGEYTQDKGFCSIGSVKSNIGHLEAAAGVAGLTKVLLQFKYMQLVPSIHTTKLNPNINFKETPFYVQKKLEEWKTPSLEVHSEIKTVSRRAGISSFGAGGSNVHIILEEFVNTYQVPKEGKGEPQIIVLSARNEEALRVYCNNLLDYLNQPREIQDSLTTMKEDLSKVLIYDLLRLISEILQISENEISLDDSIYEYCYDPVQMSQFINRINDTFNIEIAASVLTDCTTIRSTADSLFQQYHDRFHKFYHGSKGTSPRYLDSSLKLADIAYTLQVGREPMEERLAFIVYSVEELKIKLEEFCDGKLISDFFRGNVKANKNNLSQITGEIESSLFDNSNMEVNKLNEIARLWVMGLGVNWNLLKGSRTPKRLPLPTYPFARKRYWYDTYHQSNLETTEKILPRHLLKSKTKIISANSRNSKLFDLAKSFEGDEVILKVLDDIAFIKMQDRKNRNMFSKNIILGLIARFEDIKLLPNIKAVIISGYENIFCMGGTREELIDIADKNIGFKDVPFLYQGLLECEVPVIAAIQGHAVGGGLAFGLFADIILMSEDSLYSANFMKYGFTPGLGSTYILKEKLGTNIATEMMFTAKSFTGKELKLRGASFIFKKHEEVIGEAFAIAKMLSEKPVHALNVLKRELSGRVMEELPLIIERESHMHDQTFSNPEVKDRINRYFEKTYNQFTPENLNVKAKTPQRIQLKIQGQGLETSANKIGQKQQLKNWLETKVPFDSIAVEDFTSNSPNNEVIRKDISSIVAKIIHVPETEIDCEAVFQDLGVDSITGVEIIRDINKLFNLNLDVVVLYDLATVKKLTQYVYNEIINNHKAFITLKQEINNDDNEAGFKSVNIEQDIVVPLFHEQKEYSFNNKIDLTEFDVREKIKRIISKIIHIPFQEIDQDVIFQDLGIDSVTGVEILRDINNEFKLNLEVIVLYDFANIEKLAQYVFEEYKKNAHDVQELGSLFIEEKSQNKAPIKIKLKSKVTSKKSTVENRDSISVTESRAEKSYNKSNNFNNKGSMDIAVVGVSGRFPGANNVNEYWANLKAGVNSVVELTSERWNMAEHFDEDPNVPNKTYCKWLGLVDDIDKFDSLFFNISPREAELMDPQQRLFLEEAWRVFEDAGYSPEQFSDIKCGIFVGTAQGDYVQLIKNAGVDLDAQLLAGSMSSFLPARIAYHLNLTGPNIAVDTACSSSLVAIHLACQSILNGESEIALAGGVCLLTTPELLIMTSKGGMLSKDGKCKTFDNGADGFVPGEGVGVILLKPLAKAIQDNDNIYGVIKGSGVNQDGKTNGITAPSGASQTQLETEVYENYGINPAQIGYMEAHGTGTKLGDPIEIAALTKAFKSYSTKEEYCAIGSVKTNIGHGLASAGIAGFIKVLLCLKNKKLVPSINFYRPNEHINFENSPFYVNTELKDWKTEDSGPKVAAISSFGISGTNCHLVIEEGPNLPLITKVTKPYYIIPLSAKTKESLGQKILDLKSILESNDANHILPHLSYTLSVGRSHFLFRSAIVVKDIIQLRETLDDIPINGRRVENYFLSYSNQKNTEHYHFSMENGEQIVKDLDLALGISDEEYRKKLIDLAQEYVNGYNVDWQRVYRDEKYLKISLPSYPFSKESHWVYKQEFTSKVPDDKAVKVANNIEIEKLNDMDIIDVLRNVENGGLKSEEAIQLLGVMKDE